MMSHSVGIPPYSLTVLLSILGEERMHSCLFLSPLLIPICRAIMIRLSIVCHCVRTCSRRASFTWNLPSIWCLVMCGQSLSSLEPSQHATVMGVTVPIKIRYELPSITVTGLQFTGTLLTVRCSWTNLLILCFYRPNTFQRRSLCL